MGIRIVRLGSARSKGEGLPLGTVRLPPRGVPKEKFASENWFECRRSVLREPLAEKGARLESTNS